MLERAVATGRAPALKAVMERGTYVDECCAAFPSVTPVCAASIATGTRQDRHRIPSMNWYHREERRYVEYGSSFSAVAALRDRPPAHRHGLQHERRAPAGRRAHRLRVARRRGPADGRDDVPDVPRPPRAPDLARDGPDPARVDRHAPLGHGPDGALLRRHLRQPRDRLPLAARPSRRARPARRAASARISSSTTSSTSCCSRCPTTTRTRTATGRTRRSRRSRTPTASSSACSTPAAAPTRSSTSTR